MKGRRHRSHIQAEAPFAYALFGSVDIHDDDLINFTGNASSTNPEITEFLRNKSFARGCTTAPRSSYLHFQHEDNAGVSSINTDHLARVEDTAQHMWFISQNEAEGLPFARNFLNTLSFFDYLAQHAVQLPVSHTESRANVPAKWLDIQTTNEELVRGLLSRFPLAPDTVDRCAYLDGMDSLVAHSALGYFFFNLMCTPVMPEEETREAKSVMERRLDAAMTGKPRSDTPTAVPLAVVVFPEWIITVHEKPFHELNDLLKFVHINCDNRRGAQSAGAVQVMTSPFIFSSLFQIVVGHQLDCVSLTMTLDKLGDNVFNLEKKKEQRDEVMERITNVRRCFGECAAELTRREHIVSVLLQPHMMDSFLTREKVVCRQLESARAHILRLSDEVNDCRDTVAVTNWYHNVTHTWRLLVRGNKALRQTLLLTEMSNIMYPVITIQTVYSMNVPVPFDSEGDPPTQNLKAFFVVGAVLLVYLLLCARSFYVIFHKKRWSTRLLTSTE